MSTRITADINTVEGLAELLENFPVLPEKHFYKLTLRDHSENGTQLLFLDIVEARWFGLFHKVKSSAIVSTAYGPAENLLRAAESAYKNFRENHYLPESVEPLLAFVGKKFR